MAFLQVLLDYKALILYGLYRLHAGLSHSDPDGSGAVTLIYWLSVSPMPRGAPVWGRVLAEKVMHWFL